LATTAAAATSWPSAPSTTSARVRRVRPCRRSTCRTASRRPRAFPCKESGHELSGREHPRGRLVRVPHGLEGSGVTAGIKESGRSDLGLIYSPRPLAWALVSTNNVVKAPCVARNRARYSGNSPVRALVVNSGNANCATGEKGTWDNEDLAGAAAAALALDRVQDVLTASTGVIGRRLPIDRLNAAMPEATRQLSDESSAFAEAILTTDTVSKEVAATLSGGARIVGVAKGSGMIHPNMATLLAFVMTDAKIPQEELRELWPRVI